MTTNNKKMIEIKETISEKLIMDIAIIFVNKASPNQLIKGKETIEGAEAEG